MIFTTSDRRTITPIPTSTVSVPTSSTVSVPTVPTIRSLAPMVSPTPTKQMRWGEPTWFLFHTLSQKVKDESFPMIKSELLNIFFLICRNLPCPTCAEHATKYMQKINFARIQNKHEMMELFYQFHNYVNARKKYPIFLRSELEPKYENANTIQIIQRFLELFRDKSTSIRNIANELFRQRAYNQIKNWLHHNYNHFQP
jgi:hypothetical protein